ncbi:MAG: periplasmic heavy metal sensor [Alphaproteobacteria bacterium]
MSKTKKAIFTASIILNILLLGIIGGMAYKKHHSPHWQSFKESLSPETQALVQEHFDQGRADIRPLLSELMKEREQMVATMSTEPFDASKFDNSVRHVQDIQRVISDKKAQSMRELMTKVPHDERVKLADNMARFFTWDRGGSKRQGKAGPVERVP